MYYLCRTKEKIRKMKKTIYLLAAVLLLASCGTPAQISYYQDIDRFDLSVPVTVNHIKLRPEDKISIIVNTSSGPRPLPLQTGATFPCALHARPMTAQLSKAQKKPHLAMGLL